jgi:quinoprotein glucose dehydrogenase
VRSKQTLIAAGAALLVIAFVRHGSAQQPARGIPDGDWPLYSRDYASSRFSRLTQITTGNVGRLQQAWTFKPTPRAGMEGKGKGPASGIGAEVTPIVVNGIMYVPAANRVIALQAHTGREIWTYQAPGNIGNRALGYWPGAGSLPPRVIFMTGEKMMALNANTGAVDPGFGNEGTVETGVTWGGAPYVYKNLVILGNSNGESTDGPSGDTNVFDARTGAKLWTFKSIAQPGDPNHATWLDDGWRKRAGVNVWGWYFSVDEERELIFMPFGSPAGNYWGGDRPGANLYGNSLVAVDANTGKYKWHFQVVHHDLWDTDLPAAPSLFDITKDGRKIPALALISKNALMFILNRETGEPIFGVEERPVPKGEVPGEWYSPTQPFPVKPPPLARQRFSKEDLVTPEDTTAEHAQACQELWEKAGGFYNAGPFTPFLFHEAGAPPRSTLQFPGNGGPNWGGTAADPALGYVFVNTHDAALSGWVEKKVEGGNYGSGNGSPQPYDRGAFTGPGPYNGFAANGMPCQKPPWGRLFAINAATGDIAWEVILGLQERLPEGKQNAGNTGSAGPIVTAGGILFIGATGDARFRAFDSKTGRELWQTKLERNVNANPITYLGRDGRQYVAAVAIDTVVAWALP